MADKKLAQIAVHVSDDMKVLVVRLAEAAGMTVSEYVHGLITAETSRVADYVSKVAPAIDEFHRTDSSEGRP